MNNKKYPRYTLFAMMLLGAQQTLPMTPNNLTKTFCRIIPSVPKKLNFRRFIKRNSTQISHLKTGFIKIAPKIAPKIPMGLLRMIGGPASIALNVVSGIYWAVNKYRKHKAGKKQEKLEQYAKDAAMNDAVDTMTDTLKRLENNAALHQMIVVDKKTIAEQDKQLAMVSPAVLQIAQHWGAAKAWAGNNRLKTASIAIGLMSAGALITYKVKQYMDKNKKAAEELKEYQRRQRALERMRIKY